VSVESQTLLRTDTISEGELGFFHNVRQLWTQALCQIFPQWDVLVELSLLELGMQSMFELR